MKALFNRSRLILMVSVFLLLSVIAQAQQAGVLTGTALDPKGNALPNATISIRNEATGASRKVPSDAQGHFSVSGLPAGKYTLEATAPGFASTVRRGVQLTADQPQDVSLPLNLGDVSQQVTVEAGDSNSLAAQLAPMDTPLSTVSARTEVTSTFIQNFASPVADYAELTQMVPGTFTLNANGVGLGQGKTYFRGFSDGNYDIDFDGIPFYDTNSPTHHSWAFFPSQWIGGVDFDRSPGTASTTGPTPFGGSIHLLSKEMSPEQNIQGGVSYGSFNTLLVDGQYDTGNFGGKSKSSNLLVDVHHMTSDGYQTFNYQTRNAGSLKYHLNVSDKTGITGFAGVIWLDSNTPNFNGATRAQIAQFGDNFLMQNTDPTQGTYYKYNYYHVPTDFEYVGVYHDFGHGWNLNFKPYTYSYYNAQYYANLLTAPAIISDTPTTANPKGYCATPITKKGVTALPCAVDKLNSYRKYGETLTVSQASHLGVFRAGLWYEWATTNRYQIPSDPLTKADQVLPNFHENFWTNSYQPYAEFEFHVTPKLIITPGGKIAHYTIDLKQYADNGKTIGNLNGAPFVTNSASYNAFLPSLSLNYRLKPNWAVYGQVARGAVVPPSSVFDYNQTTNPVPGHTPGIQTLPKQSLNTTYQFGTVWKARRVTFDADFYYIRFQNPYSSTTDPTTGEQVNFLQPSSITKGFEAESNLYLAHGLSAYLNATVGRATYVGSLSGQTVPSGLWVAQTPTDTEAVGVTYQQKAWDLGIFNKRVGGEWQDNGSYHNQVAIDPFNVTNAFINYTIRNGSRFDQTKIRLSFNNLFDEHNITNVTPTASVVPVGSSLFYGSTATSPTDVINLLPGRSVMLTVTFGLSPKR